MAKTIRIEKRQRGFFGWIFLILFWAFNALAALFLVVGVKGASSTFSDKMTEAEQAGAAIGTAMGVGMIMSVWLTGAIILGLFVLLTRGKKVTIETTEG